MIRLHKWQLDDKRRQLTELELMRDELQAKMNQLADELTAEKNNVANSPVVNITFASYATNMSTRRENLQNSLDEVNVSIENMKDQVAESFKDLKKYEVVEQREKERLQNELNRRQQADLDELAVNLHRRQGRR